MKSTLAPAVLAVALALGGCAGAPGLPSGAATISRPMSDISPATPADARARVHVELGMAYFEVGRYDVALDEAKIALGDSPSYAPAYHLLGLAYMYVEEHGAARENFERALREAPGDPDFNNSYGWFLCSQGQERAGLEHLALAARNPYYRHQTRPLTNAGLCHLRLGEAAADFADRHGIGLAYATPRALIESAEVDAVYIATPPSSHASLGNLVARAGKPCCIEKPMSVRLHEADSYVGMLEHRSDVTAAGGQHLELADGQGARFGPQGVVPDTLAPQTASAWRRGLLEAHDLPLGEVIALLELSRDIA